MHAKSKSTRFVAGAKVGVIGAGVTVVLGLALSACSSSPSKPEAKASSDKVVPADTTTIPQVTTPTVVINGKDVVVPTEGGGKPINPAVATGEQIILRANGALPATLFAMGSTPVVWTNLTEQPVVLTINHVGVAPQTIAPGATYSWTPNVLDFSFSSSNGGKGVVNVDAFTN